MSIRTWLFGSKKETPPVQQSKTVQPKKRKAHQLPKPESDWEAVTVKWYRPHLGYGFLTREGGGKDIYIHESLLKNRNLDPLREEQKIEVRWASVQKGLEAGDVRLLK